MKEIIEWENKDYNLPLGPTKDCLSMNDMNHFLLESSSGLHKIIQNHTEKCKPCKNNLSQRRYNLKKAAEYLGGSVYNE